MGDERSDILKDRLAALVEESPALGRAAGLYGAILPLVGEADLHASPAAIGGERAGELLAAGVPLLRGASPSFDTAAAGELMIRLARRLEREDVAGAVAVRDALERGRLDPAPLLRDVVSGDCPFTDHPVDGPGREADLLRTLAIHAMKPAFRAWQRELSVHNDDCRRWETGYCFVCGNLPVLGELRGNARSLHLRCGLCGADWPYPRIRCAFCGNDAGASLGVLFPDAGHDRARAEVCDRCKGYLKVIVAYEPTPVELLPVEDLATLDLDLAAWKRGYARPSRSAAR